MRLAPLLTRLPLPEDGRQKRSINEMFGDEDSNDSDDDDQVPRGALFGSDSESDEDEEKPAKREAKPPPAKRAKPSPSGQKDDSRKRRDSGDEYDSGEEAGVTKDDEDFIDGDDDLADVLGEYAEDRQQFDDERPMEELPSRAATQEDFFDETLKSLKTGRRAKMNLSAQEMEQVTQEVLYRMDKAYADDLASIAEHRPALEKIKFLESALHILRKVQFQPMLLDFDLLTQIVKKWIQPMDDGSLPNVGVRTKMLDMISKMPGTQGLSLGCEHLKRSGLGKVVMILMKHPEETRENKELCRNLVERWSRSVFNKTLDFSKLAELEAEKAENASYRRRERKLKQKKAKASAHGSDRAGNVFNSHNEHDVKPEMTGSERAALPEQLRFDFVHRPQSKVDMNAVQSKKLDPDSRKARLTKRMQEIARPGRKSKRSLGVSIEGR
ncbi:hypothetical protein BBJ28_00011067 [Nothophytophthora sp. Chile5]|nr:hypothetical protein BBJ28_00011067 [Nothophytophthora sp. Chile5]